ncbi:glycerol-3-phosphate acyltransferase 1-like isoform X1 [Cicer arietinum]|uniref:Glycerol-3-phosphate acyltransferase 1-like isoform X1 n=1 Tax=Cicer arietinum TaxID=3827 RepID=A0A1S2Z7M4_CICAR|nr:glycerol-3-phosphate acyltransferase 1-like isoform X1 [Cicer arietinum]
MLFLLLHLVLRLKEWLLKTKIYFFNLVDLSSNPLPQPSTFPTILNCNLEGRKSQTLVCDIYDILLRTHSFFPYFMLVSFEGGSIFRAFLLLSSCPILMFLSYEQKLKLMIFITFCGLKKKDMEMTSRVVLPKYYMENLNLKAYEVLVSFGCRVFFTNVPRVMVEGFLKEYLNGDDVIGSELHTIGCYFTGFISRNCFIDKQSALLDYFGDRKPHVGISSTCVNDHHFISFCKEAYVVSNEICPSSIMPREKYPKPLIFHDGRLAFFPTPLSTLYMFMWLPIGVPISIYRILLGLILHYKWSLTLVTFSGITISLKTISNTKKKLEQKKGVLYVCTHRTLVDPIFLSMSLKKPLTTVTYSLSKVSEILSPIRTMRLTRDKEQDRKTMQSLLSEGDLVVCPEGTTCREPYLLRFSSLFAELTDEIVPVALQAKVCLFYGTTASGLKSLDSVFFFMNPWPCYEVEILEKVPKEFTCGGGKCPYEVANYVQRELGNALGFESTNITRRDKYMMLAGNEGVVQKEK